MSLSSLGRLIVRFAPCLVGMMLPFTCSGEASATLASALIFGVDNNNDFWEVDPVAQTSTKVLTQPSGGASNALAFDITREQLFYIGPDNALKYWVRGSGTTVNNVAGGSIVTVDPNNAAYYNSAYWFFEFNSNVLNKVSLSYSGTGSASVPSIASVTPYTIAGMDLPNPGTGLNTNTFGDIAINATTGILYASTTRGRFYSVDINGDPTNTFTQLAAAIGVENTHGLQLSFSDDFSILYGHSYEDGAWYTVDTTNGDRSTLVGFATLPAGGKGFRDLGGAAVVPEPSVLCLSFIGAAGLLISLPKRQRRAA